MQTVDLPTLTYYPKHQARYRNFALCYFAGLITAWTILGHTVLGFEQSWAAPLVGAGVALACQLLLDAVDAWGRRRPSRSLQGFAEFVGLLCPSLISGLAIAMLLYPGANLWPIAFASALAIGSKVMFRAPIDNRTQHIYNPSNFAISVTLLLMPWVGIAPPYHFTENLVGIWNWVAPLFVLVTGIYLHGKATGRLPLVMSWLVSFTAQAGIRAGLADESIVAPLLPVTSAAFVLFTLYMIPDPATTPINWKGQIAFGVGVAVVYGLLQSLHIVYGLFFALTIVSTFRGLGLYVLKLLKFNE